MNGDKHHFGFLVKDDFKRFFYHHKLLSTSPTSAHSCGDSSRGRVKLPARSDFQPTTIFQRYPDILVWKRDTYQQFNKYVKLNISLFS
jgi:hypothetical protein